jgi:hypothetical protein
MGMHVLLQEQLYFPFTLLKMANVGRNIQFMYISNVEETLNL